MHGGGSRRAPSQSRIKLASISINSRATFAVFSHLRKHYIRQPVMAYLYANYVRYGYSMQMQEGKSAPGSTHALSSMRDTSSARSVHLQTDQQQTVQKLCRNCAATEHNLGRSGSKDKPASCNVSQRITQQHALSETCQTGYYRLYGRQRQHHLIMSASWQTQTSLVWIQLKFLFLPSVRLVIVRLDINIGGAINTWLQ